MASFPTGFRLQEGGQAMPVHADARLLRVDCVIRGFWYCRVGL